MWAKPRAEGVRSCPYCHTDTSRSLRWRRAPILRASRALRPVASMMMRAAASQGPCCVSRRTFQPPSSGVMPVTLAEASRAAPRRRASSRSHRSKVPRARCQPCPSGSLRKWCSVERRSTGRGCRGRAHGLAQEGVKQAHVLQQARGGRRQRFADARQRGGQPVDQQDPVPPRRVQGGRGAGRTGADDEHVGLQQGHKRCRCRWRAFSVPSRSTSTNSSGMPAAARNWCLPAIGCGRFSTCRKAGSPSRPWARGVLPPRPLAPGRRSCC